MATETSVRLVDDIDGTVATTTVHYTWDGHEYEIDLSEKNAQAFAEAVAPYVAASRRAGAPPRSRRAEVASAATKQDLNAIRGWAADNGHQVSSRGRIASSILAAYHAAQEKVADVVGGSDDLAAPEAPAKRVAAKKAPAKKVAAKKAPAKKAAVRKAAAKKASPEAE